MFFFKIYFFHEEYFYKIYMSTFFFNIDFLLSEQTKAVLTYEDCICKKLPLVESGVPWVSLDPLGGAPGKGLETSRSVPPPSSAWIPS